MFADIGDQLRLEPASAWSFAVEGSFASEIGDGPNLVDRAAAALFGRAAVQPPPLRLTLTKSLPVAAGLGGGSSDAGAALRLLNAAVPTPLPQPALVEIAAELGADGPACLLARPVLAAGRGDVLTRAPQAPPLPAVLVNPRRPSPTRAVYRAYDSGPLRAADLPDLASCFEKPAEVAAALKLARNDLERPAAALEPAIGQVLDHLRAQPEPLLVRMSGSGATGFALCARDQDAQALAARLRLQRPDWWIAPCTLNTPITNP